MELVLISSGGHHLTAAQDFLFMNLTAHRNFGLLLTCAGERDKAIVVESPNGKVRSDFRLPKVNQ